MVDLPEDATLQDIAEPGPGRAGQVEPVDDERPTAPEHPARERSAAPTAPRITPPPSAAARPGGADPGARSACARPPRPGPRAAAPAPAPDRAARAARAGPAAAPSASRSRARRDRERRHRLRYRAPAEHEHEHDHGTGGTAPKPLPIRRADGAPTPANPGFVDALPGPSFRPGVPNFVIRKFRVPIFLLPIYQAAGIQYGIRWEILAAINEIETDYGRNLNVSSAGALGWMQFMPSTWASTAPTRNKDGKKDPYNPVDAIFAAARYLKAAGYEKDVRRAIFAYNHADWYVDSVMLRARLIAGVPADLVGSLTGLTEGRFPVAARARYADDLQEQERKRARPARTPPTWSSPTTAAATSRSSPRRRPGGRHQRRPGQEDRARREARALRDRSRTSTATATPTPAWARSRKILPGAAREPRPRTRPARSAPTGEEDPSPTAAASAGRQARCEASGRCAAARAPDAAVKERLFAHPSARGARENGGDGADAGRQGRRNGDSRPTTATSPARSGSTPSASPARACARARG